jgi:hypothetical protein
VPIIALSERPQLPANETEPFCDWAAPGGVYAPYHDTGFGPTASISWSPPLLLTLPMPDVHTTFANVASLHSAMEAEHTWTEPGVSPPASGGYLTGTPLLDYPFPPISPSGTSPSGTATSQSPTAVPSWWPFRNVRIVRDDIDGVELGDFIRNLNNASHGGQGHLRDRSMYTDTMDVDGDAAEHRLAT